MTEYANLSPMLKWLTPHWKKLLAGLTIIAVFSLVLYRSPNLNTSVLQSVEDCGLFDDLDEFEECLKDDGFSLSDDFLAFDDEEFDCDPEDNSDDCEQAKKGLQRCEKLGTDDCSEEKKALIAEVKQLESVASKTVIANDEETEEMPARPVKTVMQPDAGSAGPSGPSGSAGAGPTIAMMPVSAMPKPTEKAKTEPAKKVGKTKPQKMVDENEDEEEDAAEGKKPKRKKRDERQPAELAGPPVEIAAETQTIAEPISAVSESPSEPHAAAVLATSLFSDVYVETAHVPEIIKIQEKGIMQGSPDPENPEKRLFKPDGLINRAELAAVLTRWLFPKEVEKLKTAKSCLFPDVPKTQWFFPNVTVACFHLLVKGYPDKTFKPDKTINYAEAIKVIVEGAGQFSPNIVGKVLVAEKKALKKGEQWFLPYIRTAEKTGMLSGPELDIVNTAPADVATRGWVAYTIAHIPGV